MVHRSDDVVSIEAEIDRVRSLGLDEIRELWRVIFKATAPSALAKDLLARMMTHRMQEQVFGGLDRATIKLLDDLARGNNPDVITGRRLKAGTVLIREYQGQRHTVTIVRDGYVWREATYKSLSTIARAITGTAWNGPRFFGLRVTGIEQDEVVGPQRSAALLASSRARHSRRSNRSTKVNQQEGNI